MRLFANPNNLLQEDINIRLRAFDATALSMPYTSVAGNDDISAAYNIVAVDSTMTYEDISGILDDPTTVQELRHAEYPSIGDQLDALWHAMDTGVLSKIEPMYSKIKSVKDKHPKEDK